MGPTCGLCYQVSEVLVSTAPRKEVWIEDTGVFELEAHKDFSRKCSTLLPVIIIVIIRNGSYISQLGLEVTM